MPRPTWGEKKMIKFSFKSPATGRVTTGQFASWEDAYKSSGDETTVYHYPNKAAFIEECGGEDWAVQSVAHLPEDQQITEWKPLESGENEYMLTREFDLKEVVLDWLRHDTIDFTWEELA